MKPEDPGITLTQPAPGVGVRRALRGWSLTLAHHPDPQHIGRRLALEPGTVVELGRQADCLGAGVLNRQHISRAHTKISCSAGGLHLRDAGSRNGSFVNGERVETAALRVGDVVGLGPVLLLVHEAPAIYPLRRSPTLIGSGPAMAAVLDEIELVAPHPSSVLVLGETGTGKELVARELHRLSGRSGPFLAVNCGALTATLLQSELFGHVKGAFSGATADQAGLIEAAHTGTLLLDEIGDAPPALQVALLRVLEQGEVRRVGAQRPRKVDTRIVAATHRDLEAAVAQGALREDLYARLSRWVLRVPPLRERLEDVGVLAAHFVQRHCGEAQPLHPDFALALLRYRWPRNVRELALVVERALIEARGEVPIPLSASVEAMLRGAPKAKPTRRKSRPGPAALERMLSEHAGNVKAVAQATGFSRPTVYKWIREAEIDLDALRGG